MDINVRPYEKLIKNLRKSSFVYDYFSCVTYPKEDFDSKCRYDESRPRASS